MPDVLVDARALQDPNYRDRGIGRFATGLLAHAKENAGAETRLVGLIDPELPALAERDRTLFDALRTNSYTALLAHPSWFVELSPMTHDPGFVARLLTEPALLTAAIVHDLIPFHDPERYLGSPGARLRYHAGLAWLPRYRWLFTNSTATASEVAELLDVAPERIKVIGAPLDPVFVAPPAVGPRAGRHVLIAGGEDPRKNVATALAAHAESAILRHRHIPVIVPNGVPDRELARLYREAFAVVCPSRAEGFSLPVIEAMAAGAPVIASDIPVHRELIANGELLFVPDDGGAIRRLLERLATEPGFRDAVIEEQAEVWPRFRAERVARTFWDAVLSQAAPLIARGARPRVAMLTPLPPDPSGCADYSAAICPELGRLCELHLFTGSARPRAIAHAASVRPLSALPLATAAFERVVGVMGNSGFHLGIFRLLRRYGGACIAHDARMLGFYRGVLGIERARKVAAAELSREVAEAEIEAWLADESQLPTLFLSELATGCEPLVVHSTLTARFAAEMYGVAAKSLPFALQRSVPEEALLPSARAAARERLGISGEETLIATFGSVDDTKCPEECILALELLRGWGIPARLGFVGRCWNEPEALRALAAELGLTKRVHFPADTVGEATYRDFLLAADVGVQLRAYGFGSLSGALSDCIGAGLPTVANRELAEAMEAPSYVARIDDAISPVQLANAVADLLASGASRRRNSPERAEYVATHSPRVYAEGLCAALGIDGCGGWE